MKVFTELLPTSYTAKSEPCAKDNKQQKERNNKPEILSSKPGKDNPEHEEIIETERRTGEERREQIINRGRWLESRDRKDRRASEAMISVKI